MQKIEEWAALADNTICGLQKHWTCRCCTHAIAFLQWVYACEHEGTMPIWEAWVRYCARADVELRALRTCDQQHSRCDECSHTPAELLEDPSGQNHHGEGDCSCCGGEVSHERRVVVGVGELLLDLLFQVTSTRLMLIP